VAELKRTAQLRRRDNAKFMVDLKERLVAPPAAAQKDMAHARRLAAAFTADNTVPRQSIPLRHPLPSAKRFDPRLGDHAFKPRL
jgi:hypothetical protein